MEVVGRILIMLRGLESARYLVISTGSTRKPVLLNYSMKE
jgi:hypothetical protein